MRRRYPTFGFSDDHTVSGIGNEKMIATMRGVGTTSIDMDVLNSSASVSPRAPLSPRASLRAANTSTGRTDSAGLGPARSSSETGNASGNGLSSGGSGRADNSNNNNNSNYLSAMLSSAAGGVHRIGTQLARDWQDEVEKDKAKRA